jgi:hypothetical protein
MTTHCPKCHRPARAKSYEDATPESQDPDVTPAARIKYDTPRAKLIHDMNEMTGQLQVRYHWKSQAA